MKSSQCLCNKCCKSINASPVDPYPKSMYASQYMVNYPKKRSAHSSPFSSMSNFLPQEAVDLESSYNSTYKAHPCRPSSSCAKRERKDDSPSIRYENQSTYSQTFLRPNAGKFPVMTTVYMNHTKPELEISKKTVYSESFAAGKKGSFMNISNPNIKLSSSAQAEFVYPRISHYGKEFNKVKKPEGTHSRFTTHDSTFVLKPSKVQYITSHKRDFVRYSQESYDQNHELCLNKTISINPNK